MLRAETRNCSFEMDPDGFVCATMFDGATFELEDARAAVLATWRLAGERAVPVLVDSRGVRSQTRAARHYFMSDDVATRIVAVALLVESPLSRVIGSFFLQLGRQPVPTELFTDIEKARRWVRTFVR